MNPAQIKKLQKMQKDMMQAQKDIEEREFTTSVGGGLVSVTAKGTKEIINITIDKDAIEGPEDIEMLEETLLSAINSITKEIDTETESVMSQFTGGFGGFGF